MALSVIVLTRTQFGRDALRSQVVRTFNNSFDGSLEIGRLQGNLIQDLFASDVRLFDPEGREVLRVDSVAMRPHWRSLFGGAFIADEVTLVRPQVSLVLDVNGEWNLLRALASSNPSGSDESPSNPLDFHAATLRLVEGEISTTNEGALPSSVQSGTLFDYTNASLSGLNAELELDWRDNVKLFRVESFQGRLGANDLVVEALEGLITVADGNVQVDNFDLVTSRSRIRGTITLTNVSGGPENIDANLSDTRIAAADLTAILPSLPLADAVALQGHIHGPLSTLTVDDLVLSRGGTEIVAEGTLNGLPDSLAFNLTTPGSRIRVEDLLAVVPMLVLPAETERLGLVQVEGDISGAVQFGGSRSGARLEVDVVVTTDAGSVDGYAELRTMPDAPLRFTLDVEVNGVNPAVVTANEELAGNLSGRIFAERTGAEGNATVFRIGLGPSSFAGRTADSLLADGIWRGRTVEANVAIRQGSSKLEGDLFVDGDESALSFDGVLAAFNLNQLLPDAPSTRFTGPVSVALAGTSLADLQTEIEADFSEAVLEVDGAMQELPTGPFSLLIAPLGQPGSRFHLTTEIVEADLKGSLNLESAIALGTRWGSAFAYTVAIETNKRLRSRAKSITLPPGRTGRFHSPERFQLDVRVHDPDALKAFLPNLPRFASGTHLILGGVVGSDTLGVNLSASGSHIKASTFETGQYNLHMEAYGRFSANLSETLTINVEADASNLHLAGRRLRQIHVTTQLASGEAAFSIAGNGIFGSKQNSMRLHGRLVLLADRNHLVIDDLDVATAGISWGGDGPIVADLYTDAAVLEHVVLTQTDLDTDERLEFSGVLSTAPSDSVFVDIHQVDLGRLAKLGGIRPLRSDPGGILSGRLAIANLLRRPEVSGSIAVPRLMLGNRILGKLEITSSLIPTGDGVEIDLHLSRPDTSVAIPRGILLEENDLNVTGLVRFPGRDDAGERDAGEFDLDINIRRADFFFFDLIFWRLLANTQGYASGDGSITGDFSFPEFDADLSVHNVFTSIPSFGLELGLEGDVNIDRRGIHLTSIVLTDKADGTAHMDGSVLFNDYRFFSLDLEATLNKVEIIDVPSSTNLAFYGHILASGTVSVTGPLDNVFLRSTDAVTTEDSEMFIPIRASAIARDRGFLVFADSLGQIPEEQERTNLVTGKPASERSFTEGLEMNLNVTAPPGSTVHLVFDEATGDVINATGSAELQLVIGEGRFRTFGTFTASGGNYVFTAGDVFTRRFEIEPGGRLIWDGDPLEAQLDLTADYRTRASLAGLGLTGLERQRVPMVIRTKIGGRLTSPLVDLSLELDADQRTGGGTSAAVEALRPILNNTDQQALYASSVLLTGTFLLAPDG
ncbi:MAG: translocation/assembly module TamB domain-containing protein, partial [Bacteroidetes bacterium]|nr:translocation/assembly module TamB domain-containing protein [Bacteroidota bacterium]